MSGFKEPNFADRQKAAMQARQDILNKFRAKPGLDDPEVKRRQAEREAQAAARAKAREAKEAEKAEQKRLEAEAAAAEAAQDRARKGRRGRQAGRAGGRAKGQARRPLRRAQRQGQEEVGKRKRAKRAPPSLADDRLALRLQPPVIPGWCVSARPRMRSDA